MREGDFAAEIEPVAIKSGKERDASIAEDEQPPKARPEKIPSLKPAFRDGGTVTAANSSSISDGAAALVLMRLSEAERRGIAPLATRRRPRAYAAEPKNFPTAPIGAMRKLFDKTGWSADAVDLFEINEAFAVVAMAAMRDLALPARQGQRQRRRLRARPSRSAPPARASSSRCSPPCGRAASSAASPRCASAAARRPRWRSSGRAEAKLTLAIPARVEIGRARASLGRARRGAARRMRTAIMQYLLMIHANENGLANTPKADLEAMMAAYGAYTQAMKEAGVYRGGERLQPTATATVVRVKDGKTSVLNGPYAEVKEQLGGFFAIEAADLDAAIGWAARCPGAQHGAIEVRPIWPM